MAFQQNLTGERAYRYSRLTSLLVVISLICDIFRCAYNNHFLDIMLHTAIFEFI